MEFIVNKDGTSNLQDLFNRFWQQREIARSLEREAKVRLLTPVVYELQKRIPKEWERCINHLFSFKIDRSYKEEKTNMADYIFEQYGSFIGITFFHVYYEKCGFENSKDFISKLPIINKAWSGIIKVGFTAGEPEEDSDMAAVSFYLLNQNEKRKKEAFDELINLARKNQ